MNGWVVGGLGFRRTDTAHAPQLVSGVYHTCCLPTPRLRAPQAVIEKSRILRSLCKGRNSFAMEKSRALRRSAAHLGRRETGIAHPALSLRGAEQLRDGEKSHAPRLGCAPVGFTRLWRYSARYALSCASVGFARWVYSAFRGYRSGGRRGYFDYLVG